MDDNTFSSIQGRMVDWNARYTLKKQELDGVVSRIAMQRYGATLRHPTLPVFQHLAEMYEEAKVEVDYQSLAEEVERFLFELCDLYLEAKPEQQGQIRRMVGENKGLLAALWGYIRPAADQLAQTGDVVWLHRGLALAALEDCRSDYRDTYLALCYLCTKAAEQGIDTDPYFHRGELGEFALDASEKTGMGFALPAPS